MLETGELLGEPLPTRDRRNAILLYEASEGGAGVLKRLMEDAARWRQLAERALELMHFKHQDGAIVEDPATDPCVAGCYRCLLSYYNQPDHELINRQDGAIVALLDRLTRCDAGGEPGGDRPAADGDLWLTALADWGAPLPVAETIDGLRHPLCWPTLMVMAVAGPAPASLVDRCADLGRDLIELPSMPGEAMPPALANALGVAA